MEKVYNDVLRSSSNSQNLSLTVKGLLLGLIPIIIAGVRLTTNVDLPETLLNEIINIIVLAVQQITVLASTLTVCVGLFRKLWVLFTK